MPQPSFLSQDIVDDLEMLENALVTEDETPVDNLFSEKQQRLLTEPLYSSWPGPPVDPEQQAGRRPFLAAANVGLFPAIGQPPLVPDVFVSLDVTVAEDWFARRHRSYFFWQFGKAPELVVEIVSNREGNELGSEQRDYARIGVTYYIVYDPLQQLGDDVLYLFEKKGMQYQPLSGQSFADIGLGVVLWEGEYEGKQGTWIRWCDLQGQVIPTGTERAAREAERATREAERATREATLRQQAETELARLRAELARLQQRQDAARE